MIVFGSVRILNHTIFKRGIQCTVVREYAARKGTREKARKKKLANQIAKAKLTPVSKVKEKDPLLDKLIEEKGREVPEDNVWISRLHKWRIYNFAEAVQCHRETHHPTVYNLPNAPLNLIVDMRIGPTKKNLIIGSLTRFVGFPSPFDHGDKKSVLALCKDEELIKESLQAGATHAGGPEVVKSLLSGELKASEFQYVVAHPNILSELIQLRGILKQKFPSPKVGNFGPDLDGMIKRFKYGIKYTCEECKLSKDYGKINLPIGTLNMKTEDLEKNFIAVLQDINSVDPKLNDEFIVRATLVSPPSVEVFKIDISEIVIPPEDEHILSEDEGEEEQTIKQ